jgi:putative nucleotidyltransferase with HDIG domain
MIDKRMATKLTPGKLLIFWLLGAFFALGIAATLIVPLLSANRTVQVGQVMTSDVLAPRDVSYVSEIETERRRAQAERSVQEVYTPQDAALSRQQVAHVRQVLEFIRATRDDAITPLAERRAAIESVPDVLLTAAQIDRILVLQDSAWQTVADETLAVIDSALREQITDKNLSEKRARLSTFIKITLNEEYATLVGALAQGLIVPNSFLDEATTAQRRADARNGVAPVQISYVAGQVVVRAGDVVTDLQVEALEQLGLSTPRVQLGDIAGLALTALLAASVMGLYLWRYEQELFRSPRNLILLFALLLLFLISARLIIPGRTLIPYLFPAAALSMLLAVLLGPGLAIAASLMLAGLIGVMSDGSLELMIYFALGSVIATLTISRVERLNVFFWAGVYVALGNAMVVLAFRLPADNTDTVGLLTLIAVAVGNGGLSAAITLAGLFLFGSAFDLATTVQLLDLARPNHPLLTELMYKAPGTYHHSLMVANMAEQAALRIGANALLTRVGALYHDIGKTMRPYMFTENQIGGSNVHDQFDPQTSAEIIISHVSDGLEMARKARLPSRVCAFIAEHHGTMSASFLYQKALDAANGDTSKVDENSFRYPGPKPQSRETALLMLADGAEATVRSEQPGSPEKVAEIVDKIVDSRVAMGQLDESPLTLHDIRIAREAFIATLQGVFHPRLKYPEPKLETKIENVENNSRKSKARERIEAIRAREARGHD